ncbi:704_t:CDS:2, partial [Acaulospora colombiana]
MERGYLDAPPPAYRRAFPQTDSENAPVSASTNPASKTTPAKAPTLIQRFHLQTKITNDTPTSNEPEGWSGTGPIPYAAKGKGKATEDSTGPAVWEATAEKRQESLQKRKEAMILAARR